MKRHIASIALILVAVAGCKKNAAEPGGQVVATVNGQEITTADLRMEMGGAAPADPKLASGQQSAALQNIVNRKILANAARERKLDQSPLAAVAKNKAEDLALIELLQAKLRDGVPAPSAEEVRLFINDHPATFSQRKIYVVDQVIASNVSPAVAKILEPLEQLDAIVAVLDKNNIKHNAATGVMDSLSVDPDAATKIAQMPSGAVFVIPAGNVLRFSRIREAQSQPISGNDATRVATEMLKGRRDYSQIGSQIQTILENGAKTVKVNPAYKLPPRAPAAAGR